MNNSDSQEIVKRFFQCIDALHESGELGAKYEFTTRYDINRRTFYIAEKDPASNRFQVAWLTYLVRDYGISAQYLLANIKPMRVKQIKRENKAVRTRQLR